jgi:ATPase subunit of ABC transporter with duplicated ATPase domains
MQPDKGSASLGKSVQVGYLQQQGLVGYADQTVLQAFRDCVPVAEGEARKLLARFLFYGEAVFKQVQSLSGGEQMRLRMAQLMYQGVNLLVLDEPTNHLDIESREVLEEALEEFAGTIVAVSHDRHFMNRLFQRIVWLENGTLTEYLGTYEAARSRRLADV